MFTKEQQLPWQHMFEDTTLYFLCRGVDYGLGHPCVARIRSPQIQQQKKGGIRVDRVSLHYWTMKIKAGFISRQTKDENPARIWHGF